MARALMIQGAGSDVGKSLIVAGLIRAATRHGLRVLPFKPQNMSNNAAVTADGGEIGRAQALQALAAGVEPHTDMNPVLLKPETDVGAQVIVQGKRIATLRAREYADMKPSLLPAVIGSFEARKAESGLVSGGGQSGPKGHRQYGLCAACGRACRAGRRHRARRRDRADGRNQDGDRS